MRPIFLAMMITLGAGCTVVETNPTPPAEVEPYDICTPGDVCAGGLSCAQSTLPAGSTFSGTFCTSGCNTSDDCVQVPQNQTAICVNGECFLQCPTGGYDCPYGQGCFDYDSNVGPISLCSP